MTSAHYDRATGRVVVELDNGCTFAFAPGLAQGLEHATADQLADVAILGTCYGLHWEALDADLSIPGLLAGRFGTQAYMARLAGSATSRNTSAAAQTDTGRAVRPLTAADG